MDVKFISHFGGLYRKSLNTMLQLSSTYHFQIDGQTKVVNNTLENMFQSLADDMPK